MSENKVELLKEHPTGPKNIPSSVPGLIGAEYDKAIVVIVSYDTQWNMFCCSTYGTTPGAKDLAAKWSDQCIAALGGDPGAKIEYENFKATPEAVYKEQVDSLSKQVIERDVVIEALKKKLEARKNLVVI